MIYLVISKTDLFSHFASSVPDFPKQETDSKLIQEWQENAHGAEIRTKCSKFVSAACWSLCKDKLQHPVKKTACR